MIFEGCNNNDNKKAPQDGYILPLWNIRGYRATAIAYLEREKVDYVEHFNGKFYSLNQLKEACISR